MVDFNKVATHPIVVILTVATLSFFLYQHLFLIDLERENAKLLEKNKQCQESITTSKEYLKLNNKFIQANLQLKELTNKLDNYNDLLNDNSYLKVENETLKKENESFRNSSYSFSETCREELDQLQSEYNSRSFDLTYASSNGGSKEEIAAHSTVVNGLKEQINALIKSQCIIKN